MPELPAYVVLLHPVPEQPEARVNRTAMEDGMVKQAASASRVLVQRRMQALIQSKANYQAFKAWYHGDIQRAGWFDFTDPVDNVLKQARFAGGEVQFTPRRKDFERWLLGFTLETWNT